VILCAYLFKFRILNCVYTQLSILNLIYRFADDLRQVIQIMRYKPNIEILIEGYTDKVGKGKYNIDLSLKRAKSIKKYFVDQGIAKNRIETKGLGWSVPAYPYTGNEKENALNRRIEIKIK